MSMRLWSVTIKADCSHGTTLIPHHEIILDADNPKEAQQEAIDWFRHNNPCADPIQDSHVREVQARELEHLRIYNDQRFYKVETKPVKRG
jgi:hypothetical protein